MNNIPFYAVLILYFVLSLSDSLTATKLFRSRPFTRTTVKNVNPQSETSRLLAAVQPLSRREPYSNTARTKPIVKWKTNFDEELMIRTAKYDELAAVSRLLVREFYGTGFWLASQISAELMRLQTNFHYDKSKHMMLLVEDENGQVCGYCDIDGRDVLPSSGLPQRPYLSDLAVSRDVRRRGIGTMLVQSCERICKSWGFPSVYLKVDKHNTAAFKMYEKLGYLPASGFDEKDQMLLCKDLQSSVSNSQRKTELVVRHYSNELSQ